jgi:tetratricopeptide (TPR) repeat protein
MQPNAQHSSQHQGAPQASDAGAVREFAEAVPEYLRAGYRALMIGDGATAIELWENLYKRYPSAEVCGHLARAHYYQTFFLGHGVDHPMHVVHITRMREWADRALELNPNSAIGHAMLAAATARLAQISGSQRQVLASAATVRHHAEQAILIDNTWVGHYVLGGWHREMASIHPGLRALAGLLRIRLPEGKFSDSIAHYMKVLEQYPENNTIYADMAYTYEAMGDGRKAREMYETCLRMPLFRHPTAAYLTQIAAERYRRRYGNGT